MLTLRQSHLRSRADEDSLRENRKWNTITRGVVISVGDLAECLLAWSWSAWSVIIHVVKKNVCWNYTRVTSDGNKEFGSHRRWPRAVSLWLLLILSTLLRLSFNSILRISEFWGRSGGGILGSGFSFCTVLLLHGRETSNCLVLGTEWFVH
jgi:hypothetical protein